MANLHIIPFIQNLTPVEIRVAEDYIVKSAPLVAKEETAKELSLFKYIIKNNKKEITDEDIVKETQTVSPAHLKSNLFEKVLESLTLDKYITNSELFSDSDTYSFVLRKKLLICKISIRTINPGKTETVLELLDEIIKKSIEYELYDIVVDALNTKKYFSGIRTGLSEFEKINSELAFYDYCFKAVYKAVDNYYRLILNNDFVKTFTKNEVLKNLKNSIDSMEMDYKKTKSEQINYYLHIIRFGLYEQKKEFEKAIKECNKLISILKKHKSIFRNDRIGFAHTNLCQLKTFLGKYSEAIREAKTSQKYYLEDSFNFAVSKEQEFYANLYSGNYEESEKCLTSLLNHSRIDTGEFRRSKYIYYRACVHFADRNFKEALSLLHESLEIEKDKTRWNISLRVLHIMLFIEMNKIDEAFASLESLRKYVERTGKTDEISERDILIVKLLREMQKNGFEYDPDNSSVTKMLKKLSEKDSDTSWEYFSAELIPFHEWLKRKFKIK
jgi:tetratricopeptide (TPR) repeat protein